MRIHNEESFASFSFAMNCVLLVLLVVISWFAGALIFDYLEFPVLKGTWVEVAKKIVALFILGGFLTGLLVMPIISSIVEYFLENLYKLNRDKFEAVGVKQSKFEHFFSLTSLLAVVLLGIFYAMYPHPLILSVGLVFGAILSFVWVLHRQRERKFLRSNLQRAIFYISEIVAVVCFVGSFLICHLVLHYDFVSSETFPVELKRAVELFKYSEAVILGLLLGLFTEWLSQRLPVTA